MLSVVVLPTFGQRELNSILIKGFGNVGELKLKAEQGDVSAQIKLADVLLSELKPAEALKWYQAAAPKSAEAQSQAGELLLFGRMGIKEQTVVAKPEEGLRLTYAAAILGDKQAWRNMGKALQNGAGCSKDLAAAYAWYGLLAGEGNLTAKVEMNTIATKLSTQEIRQGNAMLEQMKAGKWPIIPAVRVAVNLYLNGISFSPTRKLAVINHQTLQEGESGQIKYAGQTVNVTCQSIQEDKVIVLVEGESNPRTLLLKPRATN